jgi:hypothetical protein
VAGLIVFVPLGLLEAIDDRIHQVELDEVDDLTALAIVAVTFVHAGTSLIGEIFYSGVVAAGVSETRGAERHTLRVIARRVPYGRLVVVDFLYALIVIVGVLLAVIPALVFFTWFALAGPVVKLERRRPLDAMRRSRALVRGSFWRVFAFVIPATLVTNALVNFAGELGGVVLGESLLAEWAGAFLGGLLATPPYAVALVVLTYELQALERERSAAGAS